MRSTLGAALRTPGAFVSLDDLPDWKRIATQTTPESLMIDREEAEDRDEAAEERDDDELRSVAAGRLEKHLALIPSHEAIALMLHLGVLGYPRTIQENIAEVLGLQSRQLAGYYIRRARVRLVYLAHRPTVDVGALSRILSAEALAIVRDVYATASFAVVAQKRWPCPAGRTAEQRHAWQRTHANKIKRPFFRALANVERRPELTEQAAALRHLVAHLGILSPHTGKGSWWTKAALPRSDGF